MMTRTIGFTLPAKVIALVTGLILAISALFVSPALAAPVNIVNNADWYDTDGNVIWNSGGFVIKKSETYYWYGMDYSVSGAKRVKLYTSTDLKNWTKQTNSSNPNSVVDFSTINPKLDAIGDTTTTRFAEDTNHWIGRPVVAYNSSTSKYVMLAEWNNSDGNGRNKLAFFTSSNPAGPFTFDNFIAKPSGYSMGDLGSIFTDADGSTYITFTIDYFPTSYNSGLQIAKLNTDYLGIASNTKTFASGYPHKEATTLFKYGTKYMMMASATNGWGSSGTYYYSTTSLTGTWSETEVEAGTSPSSSNSFDTQIDQVLPVEGTAGTAYVYMGDRWNNFGGSTGIGRNQWYPLSFDANGKPTINGYGAWQLDAAAGTWTTAPSPIDVTKTYSISIRWPGKGLGIVGGSTANNAKLEQRTYSGATGQSWKFIDAGGGYFNIRNVTSGLNLTLGGSTADGTQVIQYTPSTSTSQQFSILPTGGGYYKLINRGSGKVLGNAGNGADGAIITQYTDANEWSQMFSFTVLP
ncbi:RICIN domain-containing protein [Paenibacillus herberti]|uniref:Ricin B lectin domain-containing protein n=1 Tax=Paenibacillus herberti TaxID=1619309 RepID=A0A229P4A4_9BACL|nr:RICIN domain-containing protein [Paenibacillus herberti]OXM17096.1 hypothetical protein CGZ75_10860 [Paenibacillus herberti]